MSVSATPHPRPGSGPRATGPALEAMYQFILWLVPTVEKFPRSQKFLLGDRLQSESLAVLDRLIEATYSKDRSSTLRAVNLSLEKLRFGFRLAKDLHHIDFKRYEYAARAIDEIGRMVGVYLDGFDHWVKEILRAPYLRYVDDFALFADSAQQLADWQGQIGHYLAGRRLLLHPEKTQIARSREPARFLGYEILPGGHRRLVPENVRRFRHRLEGLRRDWQAGRCDAQVVRQRVGSWIAHARHADTVHLRHQFFKGGWFDPLWANELPVEVSCC